MRTLLGRRLRIIAIPQKLLGKASVQDWSAVLQMSGLVGLSHAPDARIIIEECSTAEVIKVKPQLQPLADPSKCIVFYITVDRTVVGGYLQHAQEEARLKAPISSVRNDHKARNVIFSSELFRDFEKKVFMILIAAHVADPRRVSLSRILSYSLKGGFTSEAFNIPFVRDEKAMKLDLKTHDVKEVYTWRARITADFVIGGAA